MKTHTSWPVALLYLACCLPAFAWGKEGHESVGAIAQRHLTPEARAWVGHILTADPAEDGVTYDSLSAIANWADTYERGPKHYVNVPREAHTVDLGRDCAGDECAIGAIRHAVEVLKNGEGGNSALEPSGHHSNKPPRTPAQQQARALAELVHYVGDIHQPLHVSYADDRGGNSVEVHTSHLDGHSVKSNLHKIWDTVLIDTQIDDKDDGELSKFEERLDNAINDADATEWTKDLDPEVWANESLTITIKIYKAVAEEQAIAPTGPLKINKAYYRAHIDTIDTQIEKASIRLAAVLNAIAKP